MSQFARLTAGLLSGREALPELLKLARSRRLTTSGMRQPGFTPARRLWPLAGLGRYGTGIGVRSPREPLGGRSWLVGGVNRLAAIAARE